MIRKNLSKPDLKVLAKRIRDNIDSKGLQTILENGETLHYDNMNGYIPKKDGRIEYVTRDNLKGGKERWVKAELRYNGIKGPGSAFGIYKKPEMTRKKFKVCKIQHSKLTIIRLF